MGDTREPHTYPGTLPRAQEDSWMSDETFDTQAKMPTAAVTPPREPAVAQTLDKGTRRPVDAAWRTAWTRLSSVRRVTQSAVTGYHMSPSTEQAVFHATTSFAVTIATSRAVNHIRERRRAMPRSRGFSRQLIHAPRARRTRIHHFVPGIVLGFAAGGVALLTRPDALRRRLSVPYGVGVALTTDELRLLAGRGNAYWGSQFFALVAQSGSAAFASLALSIDFVRRGSAHNSSTRH